MGCKDFEFTKESYVEPKVEPKCDVDVDVTLFDSCSKEVHEPKDGCRLIKAPRWLKRVNLRGVLIDDITIPGGFSEIKDIKKKVIITQAKLVCDQLFVEGFLEKNISFVTPEHGRMEGKKCLAHKNVWQDITAKVPFSFSMEVKHLPHDMYPHDNKDKEEEFIFKCDTMKNKCCDQGTTGPSPCETVRTTKVFLNEVPFVDFIGFKITEVDINRKGKMDRDDFEMGKKVKCDSEGIFKVLTEKVILNLIFDIYVEGWAVSAYPTKPVDDLPWIPCTGDFYVPEKEKEYEKDYDKDYEK